MSDAPTTGAVEDPPGAAPPGQDPSGDRLFALISAGIMGVFVLVNTLSVRDDYGRHGEQLPLWEPFLWELSSVAVWLLLLPVMLVVIRRAWPLAPPWWRAAGVHLAALMGVSIVHVVGMGVLRWAGYAAMDRRYAPTHPLGEFLYEFRKDALVYVAFVVLYVGWRLYRRRTTQRPPSDATSRLEVRDGARRHFVPLDEVAYIEAAGNYVELHRGASPILHRAALSDLAKALEPAGFVRIHRSRLVRRSAIAQVESRPSGDFTVTLSDGRTLAGSRRFRRPLLDGRASA